jgi:hypothetical protein
MEHLAMDTVIKRLTRDDARRIVLALWLFLTGIWISYSFSAGLGSKVAFIPPALVVMLVMLIGYLFYLFHWLWKRSVIHIAGEYEPARGGIVQQQSEIGPHPTGTFHPIRGFARPSTSTVCIALLAIAVGACAGAISNFDAAVFKKGTAIIPMKLSSVPTSADAAMEPKGATMNEINPTNGLQTEAVNTESFSAGSKTQNTVISFGNDNLAKQPESKTSIDGQKFSKLAPDETNATNGLQAEAVKTESFSADSKTQKPVISVGKDNLAKQLESQTSIDGQKSSNLAFDETNPTNGLQTEAAKTESFPASQTSIGGQKSSNLAPAAAQQGQRNFLIPVPPNGSVLNLSPRRDAWISFYATLVRYIIFGQQSERPIPRQTKVAESGVQSQQLPQVTRVHVRERGTLNGARRPTSRQQGRDASNPNTAYDDRSRLATLGLQHKNRPSR